MDEAGSNLDNCGRVRYLISGGQFEGDFGAEVGGRLVGCFGRFSRDGLGLEILGGIARYMVIVVIAVQLVFHG